MVWSIPYIGWILNILAVVFGLGTFVLWLFGLLKSRGGPAAEVPAPVN